MRVPSRASYRTISTMPGGQHQAPENPLRDGWEERQHPYRQERGQDAERNSELHQPTHVTQELGVLAAILVRLKIQIRHQLTDYRRLKPPASIPKTRRKAIPSADAMMRPATTPTPTPLASGSVIPSHSNTPYSHSWAFIPAGSAATAAGLAATGGAGAKAAGFSATGGQFRGGGQCPTSIAWCRVAIALSQPSS